LANPLAHFLDLGARRHPLGLRLVYNFSNGGIPVFASSAKPAAIRDAIGLQDFLWVGNMDGLNAERSEGSWWLSFREQAMRDRHSWVQVQHAMATGGCLVDIKAKVGADWITVPGQGDRTLADSPGWTGGGGSKESRPGSAVAKTPAQKLPSTLRQEVLYD
jgi:hypothetical protein